MSTNLTQRERAKIAEETIEQISERCRDKRILSKNKKFFLDEISRRYNLPSDCIAIAISKQVNKNPVLYLWAQYEESMDAYLKGLKEKVFFQQYKCYRYSFEKSGDKELFLSNIIDLFSLTLLITEKDFSCIKGKAQKEWNDDKMYKINENCYSFCFQDVLSGFKDLRPNDNPQKIALHGEGDEEYRTMFGKNILIENDQIKKMQLSTKHEQLIFIVSLLNSKPRYLLYSTKEKRALDVFFPDSKEARRAIALFKENQRRHAWPILESDEALHLFLRTLEEERRK